MSARSFRREACGLSLCDPLLRIQTRPETQRTLKPPAGCANPRAAPENAPPRMLGLATCTPRRPGAGQGPCSRWAPSPQPRPEVFGAMPSPSCRIIFSTSHAIQFLCQSLHAAVQKQGGLLVQLNECSIVWLESGQAAVQAKLMLRNGTYKGRRCPHYCVSALQEIQGLREAEGSQPVPHLLSHVGIAGQRTAFQLLPRHATSSKACRTAS